MSQTQWHVDITKIRSNNNSLERSYIENDIENDMEIDFDLPITDECPFKRRIRKVSKLSDLKFQFGTVTNQFKDHQRIFSVSNQQLEEIRTNLSKKTDNFEYTSDRILYNNTKTINRSTSLENIRTPNLNKYEKISSNKSPFLQRIRKISKILQPNDEENKTSPLLDRMRKLSKISYTHWHIDNEEDDDWEYSSNNKKWNHYWRTSINKILIVWFWRKRHRKVTPLTAINNTLTSEWVRQLDGGFFERFGCQLQSKLEASNSIDTEDNETLISGDENEEEKSDDKEILSEVDLNIEQLYSEILYEVLHELGCDTNEKNVEELFIYLRKVFNFDEEKHEELLAEAKSKEAPDVVVNIEVIAARELNPKDCNGLNDPFCTLYLSSDQTLRYNTSVKQLTLSPVWEEHFSLPVVNPQEEILTVEVWDFDAAETVREKISKINDVKGFKGVKKLVKEIAVTASTGKHDNELIGTAQINLNNIPTKGQEIWAPLEKKGKAKRQGEVHLKMVLSALKNSQVACQEHRHLLRILLNYKLETTPSLLPYQWCGEFNEFEERIISQHVVQCNLNKIHESLACWTEYCTIHSRKHQLSFQLFGRLLTKLVKPIEHGLFNEEEVKLFWDAAVKLLPSILTCIRKLRRLMPTDKATLVQLEALLSVLSQLEQLNPPVGYELFPQSMFAWITKPNDDKPNCNVRQTVRDAVKQGATEWFDHIYDNTMEINNEVDDDEKREKILGQLSKVVLLLQSDMLRTLEHHEKIYSDVFQFPYAKTAYAVIESKLCEKIEPIVHDACNKLKPMKFREDDSEIPENEHVTMGTALFELYVNLQRFSMIGFGIDAEYNFEIKKFHKWFSRGVSQWLDIALYKALLRIQKAVELDTLKKLDENTNFSTSPVDTLSIFLQINVTWKQLQWPDVESSYMFVNKILDDICKCSIFYSNKMSDKVAGMGEIHCAINSINNRSFQVTEEWCTAINNIEYVRQYIHQFASELGIDELIQGLAEFHSPSEASHCRETINLQINNTVDNVGNKIAELLETVVDKMEPAITQFLKEGAQVLHSENLGLNRLMTYLDANLQLFHDHLSEENFKRILTLSWEKLASILKSMVNESLLARQPPYYFKNLLQAVELLEGFFTRDLQQQQQQSFTDDDDNNTIREECVNLHEIKTELNLLALDTSSLIHAYHLNRLEEQKALESTPSQCSSECHGLLTVKLLFDKDNLHIEILNARNIKPGDHGGSCDPFVKIHLLPSDKFIGIHKPKTKTHKKNLFPLFDEVFKLPINEDLRQNTKSLVHFVLKDYDLIRSNELVGEAFVKFSDIIKTNSDSLSSAPQLHLPLTMPSKKYKYKALKVLEYRQGESMAKEFLKKEKLKCI